MPLLPFLNLEAEAIYKDLGDKRKLAIYWVWTAEPSKPWQKSMMP